MRQIDADKMITLLECMARREAKEAYEAAKELIEDEMVGEQE